MTKTQENITRIKEPRSQSFPSLQGTDKTVYQRQTRHTNDKKDPHKKHRIGTVSKTNSEGFNINNVYFDNMVSQIYPSELQLNKANTSNTGAAFLDLHLSISDDIVSTKIYD